MNTGLDLLQEIIDDHLKGTIISVCQEFARLRAEEEIKHALFNSYFEITSTSKVKLKN